MGPSFSSVTNMKKLALKVKVMSVLYVAFFGPDSKMRNSTTGGGSVGRRSAAARRLVSILLYASFLFLFFFFSIGGVRQLHLAPDPQALERSGCWMTFNLYVIVLPSQVVLLAVCSDSFGGNASGIRLDMA